MKNFTYNYLAGTRLLAQLVCPNNMSQNLTYETARDLLVGMNYKRGTTDVVIRNYAYDNLSRPISRSTARQGSVQNDTFAYNSRSELVAGTLGGNAFNFAFDEIGNQTQFACNATNETTIEGDFVPAYDADGNATLIKTATGMWSVSYNAENRPVRFECAGTQTVVETNYDYLGRRFEKKITVAGTTTLHHRYVYRGFLQIACLDLTRAGTPALWFVFWDPTQPTATRPLAIQKNGTWFVYGHDLTKNVCEVFGSDGYIKTTYSYSPFGNVSSVGNFEQNFQWSSEFYDPELDLVYYNYRHYSPITARWLSRDPIEEHGGLNLYCFVGNNPCIFFDSQGGFAIAIGGLGIGSSIGIGLGLGGLLAGLGVAIAVGIVVVGAVAIIERISTTNDDASDDADSQPIAASLDGCPPCPDKPRKCRPCNPPAGTVMELRCDENHSHGGMRPHYHYLKVNQDPMCICHENKNKPDVTAFPIPGAIPYRPVTGGGFL